MTEPVQGGLSLPPGTEGVPRASADGDDLLARVLKADLAHAAAAQDEQVTARTVPDLEAGAEPSGAGGGLQAPVEPESAPAEPPAVAVAPARATDVLAARREALGMSREDVATQLKFAARQIQALEEGRFEALPAGTFSRGMVRVYARLLKLDPAPILAQLGRDAHTQPAMESAVSLRQPVPFSDGGRRVNLVYAGMSVAVLVAICALAYDWYRDHQGAANPATPVVSAPAAQPAEPAAAQAATVAPASAAAASVPAVAQGVAPPIPAEDAIGPPGNATPAVLANKPAAAGGKRRIVMKFERESWVEVKDRNGVILLSQLNPGGTEKSLEGNAPFSLVIGNAASVRVTYNDQPVDLRPHFKVDVARFTLD